MPKVSVSIPTHNRSRLLSYAIDSVLNQTFTDWELIVCDDGSTDDTPEMMAARYRDPRIRYLRHATNIGKSNNMRSGFDAATGDYFIKFDDDDRLCPKFLQATVGILEHYRDIDFVGTDHWVIDIDNQRNDTATNLNSMRWGRDRLPSGPVKDLLRVVFVDQSFQVGCTLFRYSVLNELGYMLPNLQNCEDNDLLVRLALARKRAYYLPERLMEYRYHAGQQGVHRAIPYLEDKLHYLGRYQFRDPEIEDIRRNRLADSQLSLGLSYLQAGRSAQARSLIWQGRSANFQKMAIGWGLSWLPHGLRQQIFKRLKR